jgi:TadE-like protein
MLASKSALVGRRRRGSVLVEFALIALVLYLILAATLEFGRALFGAQVLQQAADTAAREIARTPLPTTSTLKLLIEDNPTNPTILNNSVPSTIYSENWLVVNLADVPAGTRLVDYFAQNAPIVNQLLLPLMIIDQVLVGGEPPLNLVRYPGALVPDPTKTSKYTVMIPVVSYSGGVEQINGMVPVLQEILPNVAAPGAMDPYTDPNQCPFSLTARDVPVTQRGLVALRINYPFQAVTMSATAPNPSWPPDPNFNYIDASDVQAGEAAGTYAGPNGLGNQLVFAKNVRPFRRLMSAQAIYRREVFGP